MFWIGVDLVWMSAPCPRPSVPAVGRGIAVQVLVTIIPTPARWNALGTPHTIFACRPSVASAVHHRIVQRRWRPLAAAGRLSQPSTAVISMPARMIDAIRSPDAGIPRPFPSGRVGFACFACRTLHIDRT